METGVFTSDGTDGRRVEVLDLDAVPLVDVAVGSEGVVDELGVDFGRLPNKVPLIEDMGGVKIPQRDGLVAVFTAVAAFCVRCSSLLPFHSF